MYYHRMEFETWVFFLLSVYICGSGEVAGLVGEGMVQTMAIGSSCLSPSTRRSQPSHNFFLVSALESARSCYSLSLIFSSHLVIHVVFEGRLGARREREDFPGQFHLALCRHRLQGGS